MNRAGMRSTSRVSPGAAAPQPDLDRRRDGAALAQGRAGVVLPHAGRETDGGGGKRMTARRSRREPPAALFRVPRRRAVRSPLFFSVTADGQMFLLSTVVVAEAAAPLTVVVNWSADLKR